MADCMEFPKDWAKFLEDYSFRDHKEFYTNGARLIPTFRVEQMMHHYLRKATEDAVEVVRCKDCKRRHTEDCLMQYTDYSEDMDANPEGISVEWCEDNDFCSYGERKANEQ